MGCVNNLFVTTLQPKVLGFVKPPPPPPPPPPFPKSMDNQPVLSCTLVSFDCISFLADGGVYTSAKLVILPSPISAGCWSILGLSGDSEGSKADASSSW